MSLRVWLRNLLIVGLSLAVLVPVATGALPCSADGTIPADTELVSLGASRIRALTNCFVDVFGLPSATNITAAVGSATTTGHYTFAQSFTTLLGQLRVALGASITGPVSITGNVQITANTGTGFILVGPTQITGTVSVGGNATITGTTTFSGASTFGSTVLLNADPTLALQASTKQYVDNNALTGLWGFRGLVAANNTSTPNTQYDITPTAVVLMNATTRALVTRWNPGVITNSISSASQPFGRDQAGAFGASSWVYFYLIWNGTTLASLSSASAPPTGPTLPGAYTHWAYAAAVYLDAASALVKTHVRGARHYNEISANVLAAGVSTAEAAVSLTTTVPPAAQSALLFMNFCDTAAGVGKKSGVLRFISGVDFYSTTLRDDSNGCNGIHDTAQLWIPVQTQQLYYLVVNAAGTNGQLSLWSLGYTIPNGAN